MYDVLASRCNVILIHVVWLLCIDGKKYITSMFISWFI
jgi:hypothetical protein